MYMSVEFELNGTDMILNRLEQMGKASSRIEKKALTEGATVIIDEAKNLLEQHGNIRTGKLQEGLSVSKLKRKGNKKYVQAGIQKGDNSNIFYGKFLEWGSSKMTARPFLGPAYLRKKDEAKSIIINTLKEGLGL